MKCAQILNSIMCTPVTHSNRIVAVESTDTDSLTPQQNVALTAPIFTKFKQPNEFLCTSPVFIFSPNPMKKCRKRGKISFTTPRVRSKLSRTDFHETRRRSTALSVDFQYRISQKSVTGIWKVQKLIYAPKYQ